MPHDTLGIGLAGLGRHGIRYAQHLLAGDVSGARLVAVHRRRHDEGRAWAGVRGLAYHDSLEALATDPAVDLVVAALPPSRHPGAIEAAAAAHKPVLVEKPLAPTPAEAERAAEAARRAGIPAMVANTLRYNSVIRALAAALPRAGTLHLLALNQRLERTGRPWLDDPAEGGPVLNTGVHGIDVLRVLTGTEVAAAQALGRCVHHRATWDLFAATLRLVPGDLIATLDNSRAGSGRSGRIEVAGSERQFAGDFVHGFLFEIEGHARRPLPVADPVPTVREVLRDFVSALVAGRPSPIPLTEGVAAVRSCALIAEAIARSEENRP
ncbi:MAG: Gfo/Idh/MocA family oxidoreductase [Acidobacteria bacterium]|nr:Gfo/Idh/MocA family oxidoreductase [Acidobacteriota bacterium]